MVFKLVQLIRHVKSINIVLYNNIRQRNRGKQKRKIYYVLIKIDARKEKQKRILNLRYFKWRRRMLPMQQRPGQLFE